MRAIGVVRKTDNLGRYVLPREIRRIFNIKIGDSLEIFMDDSSIILKKYEPACIFCDEASDLSNYKGKNICAICISELKE